MKNHIKWSVYASNVDIWKNDIINILPSNISKIFISEYEKIYNGTVSKIKNKDIMSIVPCIEYSFFYTLKAFLGTKNEDFSIFFEEISSKLEIDIEDSYEIMEDLLETSYYFVLNNLK